MTSAEESVPGPLTKWRPKFVTNETRVKFQEFPRTLYPLVHLDTRKTSAEMWGNPCKGYPHIEDVYLVSTQNSGASGNCYFMASMKLY